MASSGGSSKKGKKKRNSTPVVSSPNTITYGPPPPVNATPLAMPVHQQGYAMQPNFYAPEGYPMRPPGGYPAPVMAGGVPRMAPVAAPVPGQPVMPPPQRPPSRQLDFDQAMADFKGMFPKMDRDVIETVLRSNNGKVDETIDQLLKLNADIPEPTRPPVIPPSTVIPIPPSQLPPGMFPDEPPPYSPPEADSPFSRFNNTSSTPSSTITTPAPSVHHSGDPTAMSQIPPQLPPPRRTRSVGGEESVSNATRENYRNVMQRMGELQTSREWNPPVIGNLPSDFLRLSVSGDTPSSTSSPSTPQMPQSQTQSQPRVTPGIQQRLDENTNRRRSVDHNDLESNQMLEDEKLALMLQNEEFLRQLQQDPEFLSALERDYHAALREGRTTNHTPSATTTTSPPPLPSPILPPPRSSPAPLYREPPPGLANRPLPATPGPELPARPPALRKETSGSSLTSPSSVGGYKTSMTNGATGASGGLSVEDIEFRNKLEHMGKSSKTKLSLLAGRFQKKKKASKKYESGGEAGASESLLGGESVYEELRENEISHEVRRKSSKKRPSFGRQHSLLSYEDCDPHFFSR